MIDLHLATRLMEVVRGHFLYEWIKFGLNISSPLYILVVTQHIILSYHFQSQQVKSQFSRN